MMTVFPSELSGLRTAFFILKRLDEGKTMEEIVELFDGDKQIVGIWVAFAKEKHWLEGNNTGRWLLIAEGKIWTKRKEDAYKQYLPTNPNNQ